MGFVQEVELKMSNVPTPDVTNADERRRKDSEQLRKLAALISKATQIKVTELIRPKLDQHRFDRYNVLFSVDEKSVDKMIVALNGCKLGSTGTTVRISRTGNTVRTLVEDAPEALETEEVGQA